MRFNDFAFAFPALLSAVMITALLGPGAVNSIIAIGIFNVPVFARVTRGASLSLWQREFVMAARVAGKGATRITLEHILPNVASVLIVQMTIQFALAILARPGKIASWGARYMKVWASLSILPQLGLGGWVPSPR